jgi:hypothetical protein
VSRDILKQSVYYPQARPVIHCGYPVDTHYFIFLVQFPDEEADSMALVYNSKDEWSDIEKESTGETEAIGMAIEKYYSKRYLPVTSSHILN